MIGQSLEFSQVIYCVFQRLLQLRMTQQEDMEPQLEKGNGSGKFRGWRLLGVLLLVVGFIALVSALVDWLFLSGVIDV